MSVVSGRVFHFRRVSWFFVFCLLCHVDKVRNKLHMKIRFYCKYFFIQSDIVHDVCTPIYEAYTHGRWKLVHYWSYTKSTRNPYMQGLMLLGTSPNY